MHAVQLCLPVAYYTTLAMILETSIWSDTLPSYHIVFPGDSLHPWFLTFVFGSFIGGQRVVNLGTALIPGHAVSFILHVCENFGV